MTGFKELTQDRQCPGTCRGCGPPGLCQLPTLHCVCGFTPRGSPGCPPHSRGSAPTARGHVEPQAGCPRAGKETSQCHQAHTEG